VPHRMLLNLFSLCSDKKEDWKGVDDGQYNGNEKEWGYQENVGQNLAMYYPQVYYVAWPRMVFKDILWQNIEQSCENICRWKKGSWAICPI
jgi:hypothetical protein